MTCTLKINVKMLPIVTPFQHLSCGILLYQSAVSSIQKCCLDVSSHAHSFKKKKSKLPIMGAILNLHQFLALHTQQAVNVVVVYFLYHKAGSPLTLFNYFGNANASSGRYADAHMVDGQPLLLLNNVAVQTP